ncbi:hypothetical protein ACFPM7_00735 [Actinokineospora guangxiensis]|uniref:Uncharacterized protein n=1 Tax=Actinokineospora guangxiensis TaxID=1490288 RepID=A0ABW0EDU0_9PSEU
MAAVRTERSATRRVLGRVLFVLGGAAAAWAIGSATAAADTGSDLARDLGATVAAAPLPDSPVIAEGKSVVVDVIDGALNVLHFDEVEDGAKAAVDKVGESFAKHLDRGLAATPGRQVSDLLPDLPDISPQPGTDATDGPLVVAPETGRPVAVPAADAQRHGEPVPSAATPAEADTGTRRGPPVASSDEAPGLPGLPSGVPPLTLPAPAQSGHTGAGHGDVPQFGLLSTAPAAAAPAIALTQRTARADVPAAVDQQPGVTPD